jgi:hypothetical protein
MEQEVRPEHNLLGRLLWRVACEVVLYQKLFGVDLRLVLVKQKS